MPYFEFIIAVAESYKDSIIQSLMKKGCLGVEERANSIVAYFPQSADIKAISHELSVLKALINKSNPNSAISIRQSQVPDEDWNEMWKKQIEPLDIGDRFTILPPWAKQKSGRINLVINPAMAFGTGHHGTTRSCIVLMEKYKDQVQKNSFLDLGTGTGILAIVASHMGFLDVVGVDTDPLAIEAAMENLSLNGISNVTVKECGIESLNSSYDFIAANLISGVLVSLSTQITGHLKQNGIAILSGILKGQENEVIEAFSLAGLKFIEQHLDDKWITLVYTR